MIPPRHSGTVSLSPLFGVISLIPLLRTAIFFRDTLVEAALQLPEGMNIRAAANLRLLQRINRVLNEVHLEIARVYQ